LTQPWFIDDPPDKTSNVEVNVAGSETVDTASLQPSDFFTRFAHVMKSFIELPAAVTAPLMYGF
jgi:hypothetical protein